VKLAHLDRWSDLRAANAERYGRLFADAGLERVLKLPHAAPGRRNVWNQYIVRVPAGRRDALRDHLQQLGVGTEIYYPVPLHLQDCFAPLGYGPGSLRESERAARETLALPIFPELRPEEQQHVVQSIAHFFAQSAPAPTVHATALTWPLGASAAPAELNSPSQR
jgi:dTDP-4-amino-4,6-dideoxygalactose transaminase